MNKNLKVFLVAFFLSLPFWLGINFFQNYLENVFYAQISQPFEEMSFVKIPPRPQKPKLELQAKSAISVKINKFDRKKILFQEESNLPLPIASLTKLMTAIIVLEDSNYDSGKTWVTISEKAVAQGEDSGNLKIGDKLSVKDLLYIMLIESSNDAAWALAEEIGVKDFVEKMNQKTNELGLENTHFINPTGLDPEDTRYSLVNLEDFNYSSAEDLVELAQYILNHYPIIFDISLKMSYEVLDNSGQFHHLAVNKNEFLREIPNVIGGKTGFTEEAGACILLLLEDEKENTFFNVILGTSSVQNRIEEVQKLINYRARL